MATRQPTGPTEDWFTAQTNLGDAPGARPELGADMATREPIEPLAAILVFSGTMGAPWTSSPLSRSGATRGLGDTSVLIKGSRGGAVPGLKPLMNPRVGDTVGSKILKQEVHPCPPWPKCSRTRSAG